MQYYSTNKKSPSLSFGEALLKGQAPDRGLYLPEKIHAFTSEEINTFCDKMYDEIAFEVMYPYMAGEISEAELKSLVKDAYNYPVPLEPVYERKYVMRLDQGPTASFKDFAARMMGRLMQYFLKKRNRGLLILTATSGDTGSAVANAFYGLDNINVVVLFPEKEVTDRQRKQMTTLGKNVQILSLDAKFDDCQALVKEAFADPDLNHLDLSSANSINIGRLVPQSVYYFYAYAKLCCRANDRAVFCIPSGNFGDMMGGILAMKMGLPLRRFVIATNGNDEFPNYLSTGVYNKIEPSRNCISSAMNVGHPSNLARLIALYGGQMDEKGKLVEQADLDEMRSQIYGVSISDEQTKKTILTAWEKHKLLLEPHGAVGWAGLHEYFKLHSEDADEKVLSVCLETAHPAKFPKEINEILKIDPELPESLKGLEDKPEMSDKLENNYQAFKEYLLKKY
ncbi:MAG: threonine synthase [Bacteroidota bacterium]